MLSDFFLATLGRSTLVAPSATWTLLCIMALAVALSISLEQHYPWAAKVTGAIIALIVAMTLSNLGLIPMNCPLYDDVVWGYAVPLAIPMLLMRCDLSHIGKVSGRLLTLFLIGSVGTACGALVAFSLFQTQVPEAAHVAAMMTGSYIGGSVNFASLAATYKASPSVIGATTVADNFLMALYFFVLIAAAGSAFFLRHYKHPYTTRSGAASAGATAAAAYWKAKPISLMDIALILAYAATVVALSRLISSAIASFIPTSNMLLAMANAFFGSFYIWITTLSLLGATLGKTKIARLSGQEEVGTYLIYLFFFVIGVPASFSQIVHEAPILFAFTATMVAVNMLFCFGLGKLLRFNLEEIILASNANIGGPTTAAAMAISLGWSKLVGPVMIVGTLGYAIGTYAGILIGNALGL